MSWVPPVIIVIQLIIFVWLATAVMKDADSRMNRSQFLFLGTPLLWFFVVLAGGGYLPALAYWVIHYSSLSFRPVEKS